MKKLRLSLDELSVESFEAGEAGGRRGTVIVTHAAPSLRSVAPKHRRDPVTAAFASDLEWMLDGRAVLWIHGHTHFCCDYEVDGTRVVANQRGYPGEDTGGFDPACVVEVGAG